MQLDPLEAREGGISSAWEREDPFDKERGAVTILEVLWDMHILTHEQSTAP